MNHFAAGLVAVALALATTAGSAEPGNSVVTTGPDVEAITALLEQARKADFAADRSFYERTLTEDFTLGVSTGERESKQSKLAAAHGSRREERGAKP